MGAPTERSLGRMANSMRRHLASGFERAVFAPPRGEDGATGEERVIQGPGAGVAPTTRALAELIEGAKRAAADGLVKHTYILGERERVQIDARHGAARVRSIDDATLTKMMGGKDRVLRPDRSAELLRVIGIMNADGSISARNARKYKQVNHFVELCRPAWEAALSARPASESDPLRVLDLACGNGYLTFVLAEGLRLEGIPARIHGVDRREDLIARCTERAATLGLGHATFSAADIADVDPRAALGGPPDLVLALHACDTATDDALALAIAAEASAILTAPCCQAELARQIDDAPVPALARHGLLTREYASTLTDALRAEVLDASGYAVDVTEFVASEHTPKNLLLRARRRPRATPGDLEPIRARCRELGVRPTLLARLD